MFFTAINQMMTEGVDLTLVIRKANGQLTVSTLPKSNTLKDEAQNRIVPLTVSGLPEELDTGFLQAIARPIQKASGLITNLAQFEAQAEKAAAESKPAKEAKSKETKEEKEKREKYEKHLKKAEELIAAKKHSEAVTALGQARLYAKPQDQKKIDGMVEEQKKAMNSGTLFDMMGDPTPQVQQQLQPAPASVQQPQQPQQAHPQQHQGAPIQQPLYPPQPQAARPMDPQAQRPVTAQSQQQPQSMWPPQQPPQRPVQYREASQPQYMGQQPMPGQGPQSTCGGHWNELMHDREDENPYCPGQNEPAYRAEDYEEYIDFPQSMLEPRVSHYQTV